MAKKTIKLKRNNGCGIYVLFIVLLIGGLMVFLRSDFFNIKSITVEGNVHVSEETVRACCKIQIGQNIFDFKAAEIQDQLKTIARISKVSVVRIYPDKVKIVITERQPIVYISYEGQYYAVDDEGIVVEISSSNIAADAVMVTGLSGVEMPDVGRKLDFNATAQTQTVFSVVNFFITKDMLSSVSEIYISSSGYYYVYTTITAISLNFMSCPHSNQMKTMFFIFFRPDRLISCWKLSKAAIPSISTRRLIKNK
jgi:cell division protein FtsQ